MKQDRKLEELYQKVMDGTASPDEQALVARWLSGLDTGSAMDKRAAQEWQARSISELREAIRPPVRARSAARRLIWAASAAAVLLFAIGGWAILRYNQQPAETALQPVAYTEHSTTAGQRKLLTLSDGSRVWLGNASTIRYREHFETGKRELFLEGQAFFEVTRDSTRPFLVHTEGLVTKVLGTSFNIKSYRGESQQTVTVATGKVSVSPANDGQGWMLERGEQVTYHPAERTGIKQMTDLSVALSWKNGELIFRNDPLKEIARQLERWYGVSIEITSPSITDKEFSLSIKDEPLQRVLKMLALAGDFHAEINGTEVTIRK